MKKIFLPLFLLLNICVHAQTKDSIQSDPAPLLFVEQMPEYPGGENAMYKFLGKTIQYPAEDRKQSHQGKVVLQFIVETDGSLSGIKVTKSSGFTGLDEEAVRALKMLPAFKPGMQNGKVVRVYYTLPFIFKLN